MTGSYGVIRRSRLELVSQGDRHPSGTPALLHRARAKLTAAVLMHRLWLALCSVGVTSLVCPQRQASRDCLTTLHRLPRPLDPGCYVVARVPGIMRR